MKRAKALKEDKGIGTFRSELNFKVSRTRMTLVRAILDSMLMAVPCAHELGFELMGLESGKKGRTEKLNSFKWQGRKIAFKGYLNGLSWATDNMRLRYDLSAYKKVIKVEDQSYEDDLDSGSPTRFFTVRSASPLNNSELYLDQ
ncbi:hypothetical protein Tco_0903167 [Tanacetum coccineum]